MGTISYLISALLMFFVGNMQNWLKPQLITLGAPQWLYEAFTFYAILYVAAGLLSTFIVQSLKPKTENEKELTTLRKKIKNAEKEKKQHTNKVLLEKENIHKDEIKRIKSSHATDINKGKEEYAKLLSRHESTVKAKDACIAIMTNQLAEKFEIIDSYNKETQKNYNFSGNTKTEPMGNIMPDIENY
ncbi:hypothetical protein [Pectobacterium polaris]|uniref:hypothetical protein n=1 Tax=Pectobacterium polaris TaxID=2042057 RepID=UPI00202DA252|nr:hypothetical protein [Pectobacterium polaris]MCL6325815.1 hypothetical protein [Pectobacterium polaris]